MNALTEVIASFRKRAQDLEKMAADLERLAVNERITIAPLPGSNPVVSDELVQQVRPVVSTNPNPPQDRSTPPVKKRENKTGRVLTCRGLRAGVLRYLYTGEASAAAIAHAIGIDFSKVKSVCVQLVHDKFASAEQRTTSVINKQAHTMTVYVLTPAGRDEAKFFVDNPDIMIRNKQSVTNAAKRDRSSTEVRPN